MFEKLRTYLKKIFVEFSVNMLQPTPLTEIMHNWSMKKWPEFSFWSKICGRLFALKNWTDDLFFLLCYSKLLKKWSLERLIHYFKLCNVKIFDDCWLQTVTDGTSKRAHQTISQKFQFKFFKLCFAKTKIWMRYSFRSVKKPFRYCRKLQSRDTKVSAFYSYRQNIGYNGGHESVKNQCLLISDFDKTFELKRVKIWFTTVKMSNFGWIDFVKFRWFKRILRLIFSHFPSLGAMFNSSQLVTFKKSIGDITRLNFKIKRAGKGQGQMFRQVALKFWVVRRSRAASGKTRRGRAAEGKEVWAGRAAQGKAG